MSQFRIRGIDYADENLQHGIGIGSGRGRPKGSKNGQIMPGAAYMKNYKIVGEKAKGITELPGAQNTNRLAGPINPNLQRDYERATSRRNNTQNQTPNAVQQQMQNARIVRSNSNQRGTLMQNPRATTTPAASTTERTPSENVSAGRDFVQQMMRNVRVAKSDSNQPGRLVPQPEVTTEETTSSNIPGTPEERREFVDEVLRGAPDNMDPRRQRFLAPLGSIENTDSNRTGNTNQNENKSSDTNQNPARTDENQPDGNTAQGQTPTDNSQQGQTPAANAQQGQAPAANTQQEQPQAAAQQRQETPEQKSLWDNIGGWFAQAGKDIGDTVVGAWNTASGAVSDAANWVGDRLREGGEWALASMGDVGEWIGDRANDLNTWWNGQDVEVNDNGRTRQAHQTGAREAIEDWWNGRDTVNYEDGRYRRTHEAGARENIGNALNAAGQWIGNAAGDVGRTVGNAANAAGQWVGNAAGDVGRTVGNAANGLADNVLGSYQIVGTDANGNPIYGNQRQGGLVNRTINSANQAMQDARNFVTGVEPGSREAAPYFDLRTGQWVDPVQPSLGTRIGNAANDAWNGVTGAVNDAGQWVGNTAANAWNGVTGAVNNAGQAIDQWWNGDNRSPYANPLIDNPVSRAVNGNVIAPVASALGAQGNRGVRGMLEDNIVAPVVNAANGVGDFVRSIPSNVGQAVNNAGQAIGDAATNAWNGAVNAANNAGRAIGNFTSDAADAINATPGAAIGLSRAIASGVPLEYASRLTNNYVNGQISREQYEESIDRLINEGGPWGR